MLQKSKNYDACVDFSGIEKKKITSQTQRKMPTFGFYKEKRIIVILWLCKHHCTLLLSGTYSTKEIVTDNYTKLVKFL